MVFPEIRDALTKKKLDIKFIAMLLVYKTEYH